MACGILVYLRLPVTVAAIATTATLAVFGATLGDVRQQSQLTRALHRASHLALMTPTGARDPPGADLAAV
jgi:hypothetical protein